MKAAQSSLKRSTQLRPVRKASVNWKRQAAKDRAAYMAEHLRCGACSISAFAKPSRTLHCHHIVGKGSKRHECQANWLSLCERCHRHYHDGGCFGDDGARLPPLTPGNLTWCKAQTDGLDEGLLASLKGWKALPEKWLPMPLPAEFMAERARNGR